MCEIKSICTYVSILHKSEKYQKTARIFEVPTDSENCFLTIFFLKKNELFCFAFYNANDKICKLLIVS